MNLLFALPGFHRYDRGAEVALLEVAAELARGGDRVTVVGSGEPRDGVPYSYTRLGAIARENFERVPKMPIFRSETAWEDATFALALASKVAVGSFDANITCSFPFTHWALRTRGRSQSAHIYVTQNGDWPAYSTKSEFRFFRCDALICTNPDYFERNRQRWSCSLIPNGVDLNRFRPGSGTRGRFGIPGDARVILMVSALIDSKRVLDGIRAVSAIDGAHLVVAGDGPLRGQASELAAELLPGRYLQLTLAASEMPALYRSADVFLHLSLHESFGNVFLEAWASGLPIVAHDSSRIRWIVGDTQLLCDTRSPEQLTSALSAALSKSSVASTAGIERFAWSNVALQYRNAIDAAIATR